MVTLKNSFNAGDLITELPGFQKIYKETGNKVRIYQQLDLPADYGHSDNHPIKDKDGRNVCMNLAQFNMLKPLIEAQDYVEKMEIWQGEKVQFDMDLTRHNSLMPMPGGQLHKYPTLIFPQLECDLSTPWIKINPSENNLSKNKIIINRTVRYNNPYISYYFLKEHEDDILFAGTGSEHSDFCKQWGLSIPYLHVRNFLQLAESIKSCKFFLGNQSMCWHLADALGVPRIVEVCQTFPNSFPTTPNGHSFITQTALEWQFSKLLNETSA